MPCDRHAVVCEGRDQAKASPSELCVSDSMRKSCEAISRRVYLSLAKCLKGLREKRACEFQAAPLRQPLKGVERWGVVGENRGGEGRKKGRSGSQWEGGGAGVLDPRGGCSRRQARDKQCMLKSGSDG